MECGKKKRGLGLLVLFIFTIGIVCLSVWSYYSNMPPRLVLLGNAEETLKLGGVYKDFGAVLVAGFEKTQTGIETVGEVDATRRGSYKVEYQFKYHGETIKVNRTVRVVDVTPPKMQLNGAEKVIVSLKSMFKDPGVLAIDNLDGDLSAQVKITETAMADDVFKLVYSVTDSDGNTAELTRELTIKDVVKPTIYINGDSQMAIVEQDKYFDSGATARDDVDGDLSSIISVTGGVDTSRLGTQTVIYTVQDSSGNIATAQRTVKVISKTAAAANKIFLTFDDGPSTKVTTRILNILKKNNVKATFFIIDYSEDEKPILRRMINEGHTIGIHGYTHDLSKVYASDAAFMENITKLNDKLKRDFGYSTNLIRFPGGSSNTVSRKYSKGIMTRLTRLVPANGYIYYDWNISSNDAISGVSPTREIVSSVINGLKYGRNNIVLMHDAAAKTTTADALQEILTYGKNHAYIFEPLSGAIPPAQHRVQN